MRVDVKKFLFVGPTEEKEKFFQKAQDAGIIHFIEPEKATSSHVPQDIQNIISAIKILRGFPVLAQVEPEDLRESDRLTTEILDLKGRLDKLHEEKRVVDLEIARIEVFGDFSQEDLAYIQKNGNRTVQFYFAKHGVFSEKELLDEMIFVKSDHGLDYYVAVNKTPMKYENMIEMIFEDSYGNLLKRSEKIESETQQLDHKLKEYEKFNDFLHKALTQKLNGYHRNTAESYTTSTMDDRLYAVSGWVANHKIDEMEKLVKQLDVHVEEIAVEESDIVPTYLENDGASRIGEDLVHIYDTPSITDRDPSLWVLLSFALFFALIIADGGYGLIFLLSALYIRYKTKKITKNGRRLLNLVMILSVSCIIWGFASNSFFGIQFDANNPIRKYSLVNWLAKKKASYHIEHQDATYKEWVEKYPDLQGITDPQEFFLTGSKEVNGSRTYEVQDKFSDNIMMELALVIGMVHVALSFARYLDRNWAGIGWIFVIIGGYLYIPDYLQATSMLHYVFGVDKTFAAREGWNMMMGGLGLAVVLSFIRDKFAGVLEITNAIQVFADILSYLRLYALGLAGAIISATINDIASSISLFAGIILIVFGHIVNMVLAIIGGVIHGLRLNFIEWYHYSFEGGGKLFSPLKKVDTD